MTTPRDWFILLIRVLGIWEIVGGAQHIVTIFNIKAGYWHTEHTPIEVYVSNFFFSLFVGLVLLNAAPRIAFIFYRPAKSAPEAKLDPPAPSASIES